MATIDRTEIPIGNCPCGRGTVTTWEETPDHPWPSPSNGGITIDCSDCVQTYVTRAPADVQGGPAAEPGYDYVLFVERIEVQERELAAERAAEARRNMARIVSSLIGEAVERIQSAGPVARYFAAVELLGCDSAEQARSFARGRHVKTWVPEAVRGVLPLVAKNLGRLDALDAARAARKAAAAEAKRLGLPTVRYWLKTSSKAAVVGR